MYIRESAGCQSPAKAGRRLINGTRGIPTTIESFVDGSTRSCRVKGAIESWNCSDVVKQIDPQVGERLLVDLSGVREVDSTGLGELIELHQRMLRGGGALALAHPSVTVKRLLDTTRLCRFFTVLEDEISVQEFMAAAKG